MENKEVHPVYKGWDSVNLIGRVKDRFKELKDKQWDWRSFYNGWLEGRSEMLKQLHDEYDEAIARTGQPPISPAPSPNASGEEGLDQTEIVKLWDEFSSPVSNDSKDHTRAVFLHDFSVLMRRLLPMSEKFAALKNKITTDDAKPEEGVGEEPPAEDRGLAAIMDWDFLMQQMILAGKITARAVLSQAMNRLLSHYRFMKKQSNIFDEKLSASHSRISELERQLEQGLKPGDYNSVWEAWGEKVDLLETMKRAVAEILLVSLPPDTQETLKSIYARPSTQRIAEYFHKKSQEVIQMYVDVTDDQQTCIDNLRTQLEESRKEAGAFRQGVIKLMCATNEQSQDEAEKYLTSLLPDVSPNPSTNKTDKDNG